MNPPPSTAPSNTVITDNGALAHISADELEIALQRFDGALFGLSISGVRNVAYLGLPGDILEELPAYCAFTYDGRVLAN